MPFADFLSSILPGAGTALGGAFGGPLGSLLGGLGGKALGGLFGGGSSTQKQGQLSPQIQQLLQQLQQPNQFQQVDFNPIRQQEINRFQQQTIPGLAERFSGIGGQRSSAFQQSLGGAGADLASRLAELQAGHEVGQQQARQQFGALEQGRLGQLASLLSGQQQFGEQQAQRQQQGLLQGAGLGLQGLGLLQRQQLANQAPILSQLLQAGALGTGQQFGTQYVNPQSGILGQLGRAGLRYSTSGLLG